MHFFHYYSSFIELWYYNDGIKWNKYINDLSSTTVGYLYYLSHEYGDYNSYFEFEIELNNKNDDKSFSLSFVKDSSTYYSSYSPLKNQTISYSELDIQEKDGKSIMKWSKTFSFSDDYLGLLINPDRQIGGFTIRLYRDCRPNDFLTIIIFAVLFGNCIFLCVLTLIFMFSYISIKDYFLFLIDNIMC